MNAGQRAATEGAIFTRNYRPAYVWPCVVMMEGREERETGEGVIGRRGWKGEIDR